MPISEFPSVCIPLHSPQGWFLVLVFFLGVFVLFMVRTTTYRSSWARGRIQAVAVTYAGAATMDPLTHCARLGVKLEPLQ